MKWQEFTPIQHAIQDALPQYVYAHNWPQSGHTKVKMILCDWRESQKYFEKTYEIEKLEPSQVLANILEDIREFNNVWNSPLNQELK